MRGALASLVVGNGFQTNSHNEHASANQKPGEHALCICRLVDVGRKPPRLKLLPVLHPELCVYVNEREMS